VVFEDSPTGLAAGEAAGCYCVAVPDVVQVAAAPGRMVLRSLIEVDVCRLFVSNDSEQVTTRSSASAKKGLASHDL